MMLLNRIMIKLITVFYISSSLLNHIKIILFYYSITKRLNKITLIIIFYNKVPKSKYKDIDNQINN